ncbi:MAG: hypothetical protein V1744_08030 [Candidatus Altiarchaeota archaeon]
MANFLSAETIPKDVKEAIIPLENNRLRIVLSSGFNLLFHTLNLYDQLTGSYHKYRDTFPDKSQILRDKGQFRELSRNQIDKFYAALAIESAFDATSVIQKAKKYHNLGDILENEWDTLYGKYWVDNYTRISQNFDKLCTLDWRGITSRMEEVTGYKFKPDILVVPAEGSGQAAHYRMDANLSIGNFMDGGFFHEGLHLLLRKQWAEDELVKGILEAHGGYMDKFWKDNSKERIEQAVVVSLDSLLRSRSDAESYFGGCMVGDLYPYFYGEMRDWYETKNKKALSDLVYGILKRHESEIFSQERDVIR